MGLNTTDVSQSTGKDKLKTVLSARQFTARRSKQDSTVVGRLFASEARNRLCHLAYPVVLVNFGVAALGLFVTNDPDLMIMVEQLSDDIV